MLENWSYTALLVHGAALTYVIGFLIRDQLILRCLVLFGSLLYIAYYYLAPDIPLWDAIAWTIVMVLANAFTMFRLMADKRTGRFAAEDLILFGAIHEISPGDFRRLLSISQRATVKKDLVLTKSGVVPEYLYFVMNGETMLWKYGHRRPLNIRMFVGEIAYLLGRPASATVTLRAGGRYSRWRVSDLRALAEKHDGVRIALQIAFNRDLALKVAAS